MNEPIGRSWGGGRGRGQVGGRGRGRGPWKPVLLLLLLLSGPSAYHSGAPEAASGAIKGTQALESDLGPLLSALELERGWFATARGLERERSGKRSARPPPPRRLPGARSPGS